MPDDLPIRQAVFVEEYLTDFNGTNAARKAGYSEKSAAKTAVKLGNKSEVRKAIVLEQNHRQTISKTTAKPSVKPSVKPSPRQAVFVEEYVTDFNATNAAKRAGYSEKSADKIGSKLVGKSRVLERCQIWASLQTQCYNIDMPTLGNQS